MGLSFEWDPVKAASNEQKHGVSFEEAATAFHDPLSITIPDPDHSTEDEDRFVLVGTTLQGKLAVIGHAERGDRIRIITARAATRRERQTYEEAT